MSLNTQKKKQINEQMFKTGALWSYPTNYIEIRNLIPHAREQTYHQMFKTGLLWPYPTNYI